jgi:hypothetical protein
MIWPFLAIAVCAAMRGRGPHGWLLLPRQSVPIGGGFGRIFRIGNQPVSANIAGYYNVVHPTGTPNWQLRAELSLLFPER